MKKVLTTIALSTAMVFAAGSSSAADIVITSYSIHYTKLYETFFISPPLGLISHN